MASSSPEQLSVPVVVPSAKPSAGPVVRTISDPLRPDAPIDPDDARPEPPGEWSKARPGFQRSLSAAQRGGVEPCAAQPVDDGFFEPALPRGRARRSSGYVDDDGSFDLVIHSTGRAGRREMSRADRRCLLTITSAQRRLLPLFTARSFYPSGGHVEQ